MQAVFIVLLLSLSLNAYAGERLKGISGSMKESSAWFSSSDDSKKTTSDEKVEEKVIDPAPLPEPEKLVEAAPDSYYDHEAGCMMTKAYILDVENPEQYERLEDYPFTYECAMRR